jgi:hypothetical protein
MLLAQFLKRLSYGLRAAFLKVRVSLADAFDSLLVILPLPLKIIRENIVEGGRGILTVPPRVLFQLSLAFGFEGHHLHAPSVRITGPPVNGSATQAWPKA